MKIIPNSNSKPDFLVTLASRLTTLTHSFLLVCLTRKWSKSLPRQNSNFVPRLSMIGIRFPSSLSLSRHVSRSPFFLTASGGLPRNALVRVAFQNVPELTFVQDKDMINFAHLFRLLSQTSVSFPLVWEETILLTAGQRGKEKEKRGKGNSDVRTGRKISLYC